MTDTNLAQSASGPTRRRRGSCRHSVRWLGLALAVLARPVAAEPPLCPETETGRVVVAADGLHVAEPKMQGLRGSDVLVQLNSHVLRSCTDLIAAMAEVREHQLAVLLLVRRDDRMVAVVAAVVAPTPPVAPTTTPVAVGASDVAPVRDTLVQLLDFGRTLRANLPLPSAQPWVRQIGDLRQAYERRRAATPAVGAVEPIVAYYQLVAELLVYKDEALRSRNHRPQPDVVLRYHSGSPVSAWLQRYPFLEASVIEFPENTTVVGWGERNGRWSPDRAIALLVDRALTEGEQLARTLGPT